MSISRYWKPLKINAFQGRVRVLQLYIAGGNWRDLGASALADTDSGGGIFIRSKALSARNGDNTPIDNSNRQAGVPVSCAMLL